jgi:hypothetical protein
LWLSPLFEKCIGYIDLSTVFIVSLTVTSKHSYACFSPDLGQHLPHNMLGQLLVQAQGGEVEHKAVAIPHLMKGKQKMDTCLSSKQTIFMTTKVQRVATVAHTSSYPSKPTVSPMTKMKRRNMPIAG